MKFRAELCVLLLSFPAYASRHISLNVGPTFQYTKYNQGNLPKQIGSMVGPAFNMFIKKAWRPTAYIGFRGLWDIPHICSDDGLIIDSNEYEVNAHLGFNFEPSSEAFSIIPFTGIDFIHLSHTIKDSIIRHKYFQINVPVGIEFIHYVSKSFSWGIKPYYDIDAWTRLKVSTPSLCDTKNCKIKLKRCHRFHIELPLKCHYETRKGTHFDISCIPLFTWQKFNSEKKCSTSTNCSTTCSTICDSVGTTDPDALNIPVLKQWHLGSIVTLGISF